MYQYKKSNIGSRAKWLLSFIFAIACVLGMAGKAVAQSDNGSIVGTVADDTGAFIPNAAITVKETQTGVTFQARSSDSGEFTIPTVPRGDYTATVTAAGFQGQSVHFTVLVATSQNLNFKLSVGDATQSITVTDAAPLVDTSNASIGSVISGKQVTDLPLNGRNFTGLAILTPGVTRGAYGDAASGENGNAETFRNAQSGGGALSVNGLRPQADNFLLDGLDDNDSLLNTILIFPNIDALQEFKVDTSIAPAQYGRAGGAIISNSLRGGTNDIHGSAFWYYRSGKFDANPYYRFQNAPITAKPPRNRNQPGFSIGGPIIKDKLFLFGDYQAFREVLPQGSYFVTVPTARMRTGDFSELLAGSPNFDPTYGATADGQFSEPHCLINAGVSNTTYQATNGGKIYNPAANCTPYAGNVITAPNTAAVNYFNAYPAPTRAGVINNYLATEQSYSHYNTFDVRLDWTATAKDLVFARFSYDNSTQIKTPELVTLPAGFGTGSNYVHARSYALGETHTFSPAIVNQLLIGYNRDNYGYQPPFYGDYLSQSLGIVNANRNEQTTGGALIGGNAGIDYTGDYGLYAVPQNTIEISDNVNYQKGHHAFQFGATGILRNTEYFRPISGKGYFNFGNGDFTGFPTSEMMGGFTDSYSIGAQNGYFSNIAYEDGFYGQDTWRASKKLTLQLGVRYDILTRPYETQNRQASFDVDKSSPTYGQVLEAGVNGVSRTIVHNDFTNIAPRVGFTYDLTGNGKTVVRGGYGIFYFPDYGGINNQLGQQAPFGGSLSYNAQNGYCVTFTGQTPAVTNSYGCAVAPQQSTPLPAPGYPNFNRAAPPAGLTTLAVNRNDQNQQIQEFNLQLSHQLGLHDVFTAAYVGSVSRHLSTYYNYNLYQFGTGLQNFPTDGAITYNNYNGASNYNGLQLHFEHRQGNDLLVTASYSLSHALDDSPGSNLSSTIPLYYNPSADYGNSLQDQRQVFSSSIVYELPFGQGKRFGGRVNYATNLLIAGWQFNVIGRIATGTPFDLNAGSGASDADRPDVAGAISYPKNLSQWFTRASFVQPLIVPGNGVNVFSRLGTVGRDKLYGPGDRTGDVSVQKNIYLTHRYVLQLHGDFFNITNTPQFTNPDATLTDGNYGQITSIQQNSQREVQLAARFTF